MTFKVVIVGDSGVGKTSLILRAVNNEFDTTYMPSTKVDSCDYYIRIFFPSEKPIVKLTIWDTAGQEMFKAITKDRYRDADAIVIVYDVNNRESFDHIDQLV